MELFIGHPKYPIKFRNVSSCNMHKEKDLIYELKKLKFFAFKKKKKKFCALKCKSARTDQLLSTTAGTNLNYICSAARTPMASRPFFLDCYSFFFFFSNLEFNRLSKFHYRCYKSPKNRFIFAFYARGNAIPPPHCCACCSLLFVTKNVFFR